MKRGRRRAALAALFAVVGALIAGCAAWYFLRGRESGAQTSPAASAAGVYRIAEPDGFIADGYGLADAGIVSVPADYQGGAPAYLRSRVSDHSAIGMNLSASGRTYVLGAWNAMNFSLLPQNATAAQAQHARNVAAVIAAYGFDAVGITEVNKSADEAAAAGFLGLLSAASGNGRDWRVLLSEPSASLSGTDGQDERVAIVYDANRVAATGGRFYPNPPENGRDYVRPPYGARLALGTDAGAPALAVTFAHFDSPGANSANGETSLDGVGSQERHEASRLGEVLDDFAAAYKTAAAVFMGDTNIPAGKQADAFDEPGLARAGYAFSFLDAPAYDTTLATAATVAKYPDDRERWYANPYDKIVYRLDAEIGLGGPPAATAARTAVSAVRADYYNPARKWSAGDE